MFRRLTLHTTAWWLGLSVAVVLTSGGVAVAAYYQVNQNKILPGVHLGSLDVAGLTHDQAEAKLQTAWDKVAAAGIPVIAGEHSLILTPIVTSAANPDLTYELVHFDASRNADVAWALGHRGTWLQQWLTPLITTIRQPELKPEFDFDTDQIAAYLRQSAPRFEQTPHSARVQLDELGSLSVVPEAAGTAIDLTDFEQQLHLQLAQFALPTRPLQLKLQPVIPELTEARVLSGLPQVRELMRSTDLTFTFEQNTWRVPASQWHQWLTVRPAGRGVEAGLSLGLAADFFTVVGKVVNQTAEDAKLELTDGRVTNFKPSRQGRQVDVATTLASAEALLRASGLQALPLTVMTTNPSVSTADANSLGIADIIGVGTSNFAGSPKNRLHNIRTGAAKLNGVIIKPDEEFSLITTLGTIDQASGYLQELVIKGNQTLPEFGGGLCQIGTTTFRAALATGLPILERRNHSYRVTYYEPAGTDATIYDPKPDFRFKNDTGGAILIQTRIEGTNLIFEFWGTKDGRTVDQTKPELSNFTPPPPAKLVETEDLPVGEKKCTEKAHVGADAKFNYTVTYADGHEVAQVFKSHYVPWQEVCLIGVPKGTLPVAPVPGDGSVLLPSADAAGVRGN